MLFRSDFFFKYSLKFNGVLHAYGLPVLGAATHRWLRWGVRLALEKKLLLKKVKNHKTGRID